jgi:cyanobactin maturation PatA/PatG family protease
VVPLDSPGGHALAHGTHVASVIFGQPGSSVEGIAPSCRGLIVPIFADGASEGLTCSQLDLARAILMAIENGANVINISGGQLVPTGEPEPILAHAIESAFRRNCLIVAAAGNDGCECLHVPAAAPTFLAVGAMDRSGDPVMSSNWGPVYRDQGLLAPGVDVLGAALGGGTARRTGTSFAAPFVSGLAGLLASLQVRQGHTPDLHAIRNVLLKSAIPCPLGQEECRRFLAGRLNVEGAVELLLAGGDKSMTDVETLASSGRSTQAGEQLAVSELIGNTAPVPVHPPAAERAIHMSEDVSPAQAISAGPLLKDAPIQMPPRPSSRRLDQVGPSDCGCGGGANCTCAGAGPQKPTLVYALGKLGYDFGSEARRDSFVQAMPLDANNPFLPDQLLSHLEQKPYDAESLIWTLNLDATPIYAIKPAGAFGTNTYERLREFLQGQVHEGVEIVSIPGVIVGTTRLQSGQVVPTVMRAVRGMYSWATKPLVKHVLGESPDEDLASGLTDFLNRVYFDLRNLGVTAEERALNYSATNAVQVAEVVRSATQGQLDFDKPVVVKSPVCRPDSDCYDVELLFFDPNNTNKANRIYRFTVDVSDIIPVTIGTVRSWTRRA